MKIYHTFYILLLLILLHNISSDAQIKLTFFKNVRNDAGLSYNFFTGKDASDFKTTVNGFGSGFIFDMFTGRYSFDMVTFGTKKLNLSLGAGIAISKYRFSKDLVIASDGNTIIFSEDTASHNYGNGFFSYGKSKLVYGSFFVPLNLNLNFKQIDVSAGILIDQYISGKLKRKYKVNGSKESVVTRDADFSKYFLNKTKYGINAMIKLKKSGLGFGFTYMLTPFFEDQKGPELNETRFTITYDLKKLAEDKIKERNSDEINL